MFSGLCPSTRGQRTGILVSQESVKLPGALNSKSVVSSRKHAYFRDMATDFAPMQVHDSQIRGTHTDPRLNERVDHGRLTQNPWWPH